MLNKKISDLPQATALTDHDLFAVLQEDNTTRKINFVDMIREVNSIIEISFDALTNLISTGAMSPGSIYQIAFQTKHEIPNTSVINTGEMEHLLLYAVSSSDLLEEAISIEYPQDQVLFDVTNVLCEDGTTARQGKITYRKDRINNLETWYDFRNVKFRRWKRDTDSNTAWVASTSYSTGAIVYNSNVFYKCIIAHTSDTSFVDTNWKIIGYADSSNYVAWNNSSVNGVNVNASSFTDLLTFNYDDTHDISIKPMYDRTAYNNIVFAYGDCPYGFTFGENCSQMTISGANYENSFGRNCGSAIIGDDTSLYGEVTGNIIGDDAQEIYLSNAYFNNIGSSLTDIVLVNGAYKNIIEAGASGTNIESTQYCIVGPGSTNNKIGAGCEKTKIGANSSNNVFVGYSDENTLGSNCSNNIFINSEYNRLGDECSDNTFNSGSYINSLASRCSDNTFSSSNKVAMGAESGGNTFTSCYCITLGSNSGSNSFTSSGQSMLGDSCSGNVFINGSYGNSLDTCASGNHFDSAGYIYVGVNSSGNSFSSSYRISLGVQSNSNTFSNGSDSISIGNNSNSNTFSNAENININNASSGNTFSESNYISLGNYCQENSFLNGSNYNSFGNYCSSNIIGDYANGGSSNNSFENNCNSNSLWGGSNHNSLGNNCSSNNFGIGSTSNMLGNNCNNNLLAYGTGSSSGGFSNNKLGAGCNNINMRGNGLMFGEGCSYITIDYSLNCQFAPGLSNKTFPGQNNSSFMISDTTSKTFTTSGYKIVVDKCSGDGSWWYDSIDNSGVETAVKFV